MSLDTSGKKPLIVVVGGFLGAGKTTLLLAASAELEKRGLRSALVLNDQGDALVDSAYAAINGVRHGEVTGGCFCCRLSELVLVMDELRRYQPDVIFAEPVGSCTDISATTLQPLRELSEQFRLAPFTVLVDPARAEEMLGGNADHDLKFLFTKQLQEADIVCFTKADTYPNYPKLGELQVQALRQISARTGEGIAAWLDEVMLGTLAAGSQILDIDYERYACAEAALAWLNLRVDLELNTPCSPAGVLGPLFDKLDTSLAAAGIMIVHMKALMNASGGYIKAATCANGHEPVVEGNLDASPETKHTLLMNLRAVGEADKVSRIVLDAVESVDGELGNLQWKCFHPAAPRPERRVAFRVE